MTRAPDEQQAVRRSRRAAFCFWGIAALGVIWAHAAPAETGQTWLASALAFLAAGFAATCFLASFRWQGTATLQRLPWVWTAMVVWIAPAVVVTGLGALLAGLVLLPPADLKTLGWTGLWGGDLAGWGALSPGQAILLAGLLVLGWTLLVALLDRLRLTRWTAAVAWAGAVASALLDLWLRAAGAGSPWGPVSLFTGWSFLVGAGLALSWPQRRPPATLEPLVDALARIGAVGLPLVLWCWPLLALPRWILTRPLETLETAGAVACAAALAVATHRWIERPLRARLSDRPSSALAASGAGLVLLVLASAALFALDGLPGRASAAARAEAAARVRAPLQAACNTEGAALPPADPCTLPAGGRAEVVIWGNSHADQLSPAVLAWAADRGLGVRQATKSACLPLLDTAGGLASPDCVAFNRAAVAEWARVRPKAILVGAGWSLVLRRSRLDEYAGLDILARQLAETLRALRAAVGPETRIVLVGNSPDFAFDPSACRARRAFLGLDVARCDLAAPEHPALARRIDERLAGIAAAEPGVFLYRPWPVLCAGAICRTRGPGEPWFFDRAHLTAAGGRAHAPALAAVLAEAVP